MSDTLIHDALVLAITDAFFHQKSYYIDDTGRTINYGGEMATVVAKIMKEPEFQIVIDRVNKTIKKEIGYEKIIELVRPYIKKYLETSVQNELKNRFFGLDREVSQAREEYVEDMVKKALINSKEINNMIEQKVKEFADKDFELDIRISVVATPKK